ncbi:hypothetical protein [Pedosphaera parvula]|uniref:hypothetical protein n=1 Tax=Pedosphaera parvula TaxID=1032527 RepID=UPI0012370C96|nr:hypothetical protein [Pedosphaera parvula]
MALALNSATVLATSDFPNLTKNNKKAPGKRSDNQRSKYGKEYKSNDRIDTDLDQTHNTKEWKRHMLSMVMLSLCDISLGPIYQQLPNVTQ